MLMRDNIKTTRILMKRDDNKALCDDNTQEDKYSLFTQEDKYSLFILNWVYYYLLAAYISSKN